MYMRPDEPCILSGHATCLRVLGAGARILLNDIGGGGGDDVREYVRLTVFWERGHVQASTSAIVPSKCMCQPSLGSHAGK